MPKRVLSPVFAAMLLAACATTQRPMTTMPPAPPTTVAASTEPDANDNLNSVVWAQTAIEHDLIFREIYRHAGEQLLKALADPDWDALPREERKTALRGLKPAVIVDIDETVLDNSPYQARLVRDGGDYSEATWVAWCRERKATALPGALAFAQSAAKQGVIVFYLSNRAQDLSQATVDNLRADGFPLALGERSFLGLGLAVAGCEQLGTGKTGRRDFIGRSYRGLLQIGDQVGDFVGVRANTPDGRSAAIAPYQHWIGERWFVLPNPTYGAWEPALFNNDWSLPLTERRRLKRAALSDQR